MVSLFLASIYDAFMQHTFEKQKQKFKELEKKQSLLENGLNVGQNTQQFFSALLKASKEESARQRRKSSLIKTGKVRKSSISTLFDFRKRKESALIFHTIQNIVINIFEKPKMRKFVTFSVVLNIVIMSMNDSTSIGTKAFIINLIDFLSFCFFFVEVNFQIITYSRRTVFENYLFILDLIIIYSNFLIYIYDLANGISVTSEPSFFGKGIRIFKVLRIFRVVYYNKAFESLSIIIKSLVKTLRKMSKYFIILTILILVLALMGMVIFSNRGRVHETKRKGLIPVK